MTATDITVAVDGRGRTTPLGEFVFGLLAERERSVSWLSRESNLSRSFLYLLKDDRQVPSLDTLVALFQAIGVDDVRIAGAGERGDLVVVVDGRTWWIRLPGTSRRAERSRSAMQTLASAPEPAFDAAPPRGPAATYDLGAGGPRRSSRTDERQRLLGELLAAASDLDKRRLELLVEHARLLGKG